LRDLAAFAPLPRVSFEPPSLPDSVSSAVTADQVAAQAAEAHGHHGPIHTHCENCGTKLDGPFCHRCGQHDFEFHRSFGHVFMEALENFFHFDAKFFRNIVTLLFKPGQLTADFNAGKRASQMPPFRLYLFVSVLFFFLGFIGKDAASFLDEEAEKYDDAAVTEKISFKKNREEIAAGFEDAARAMEPGPEREKMEAAARDLRAGKSVSDFIKSAVQQLPEVQRKELAAKTKRQKPAANAKASASEENKNELERFMTERGRRAFEHPHEMKEAFIHALPRMLLVCLPFFALFTRVLFRKSGQVYLQHLVLALHFHTFIYLFLLVRGGWVGLGNFVGLGSWISFAAALWLIAYPFLMFRRLVARSWTGTIARTFVLSGVYALTLGFAFIATLLTVFLTI
jgi:Arc/MetJ-type ribon-helix-helix transcriptional regulator